MINDQVIQEIKAHLKDYLEELGINTNKPFNCLNPKHKDTHPSMSYDDKRNIVKCFSCDESYDIISLYALNNNLDNKEDFKKIINELALKYNIKNENSVNFPTHKKGINPTPKKEDHTKYINKCKKDIDKCDYLLKRGLTEKTIKKHNIGYDKKEDMIILPISNTNYLGRYVNGNKNYKYHIPKGTTNELFNNKYLLDSNFKSIVWVTEGIIDALSLEEISDDIKVISLNSINNASQLVQEAKDNNFKGTFILALDTDQHGIRASEELKEDLEASGIKAHIFNSNIDKYNINTTFKEIVKKEELEQEEEYYINEEEKTNNYPKQNILERENYIKFRVLGVLEETYKDKLTDDKIIKEINDIVKEELGDKLTDDKTPFNFKYDEILETKITIKNKDINEWLLSDKEHLQKNVIGLNDMLLNSLETQAINTYKKENVLNYLDTFNINIQDHEKNKPLSTGIKSLDEALEGGFYKKNLVILGAISSLGKTTLALQIGDNIARKGNDVLIFSLEMSKEELIAKSISRNMYLKAYDKHYTALALTTREILKGVGLNEDIPNNTKRVETYKEAYEDYKENIASNVYITECNDDIEINVNTINEKIKNHIAITGNDPFVIIDYLQIIQNQEKGLTDKQVIDKIVTSLKRIARDNNITILLISAFNRASYNQESNLASFRDSSTIEYTSDVLISLQHEKLDGVTDDKHKVNTNQEQQKNERELTLKVLKNRNGRITDVKNITFYAKYNYMQFKD